MCVCGPLCLLHADERNRFEHRRSENGEARAQSVARATQQGAPYVTARPCSPLAACDAVRVFRLALRPFAGFRGWLGLRPYIFGIGTALK